MPSLCAGMPLITMHYAPIIKRREALKSMTHRAYGRTCVSAVRTCPPAGTHTLRTASVAHHPALSPPLPPAQTACHGGLPRLLSTPWRDQRPEMEIVLEFCVFSELASRILVQILVSPQLPLSEMIHQKRMRERCVFHADYY